MWAGWRGAMSQGRWPLSARSPSPAARSPSPRSPRATRAAMRAFACFSQTSRVSALAGVPGARPSPRRARFSTSSGRAGHRPNLRDLRFEQLDATGYVLGGRDLRHSGSRLFHRRHLPHGLFPDCVLPIHDFGHADLRAGRVRLRPLHQPKGQVLGVQSTWPARCGSLHHPHRKRPLRHDLHQLCLLLGRHSNCRRCVCGVEARLRPLCQSCREDHLLGPRFLSGHWQRL